MAADLENEGFNGELEEKLNRLGAGAPLLVLDLFSGCGGMSLGLRRAGYVILGGVEINQQAVTTYARNLFKGVDEETFELHNTPRDITEFPPEQFLLEILQRQRPQNLMARLQNK